MASIAAPGRQRSPTSVASPGDGAGFDAAPQPRGGGGNAPSASAAGAGGAKHVTPPPKAPPARKSNKLPKHPEMKVEDKIVEEILLVMGAIGSTPNPDDIDPATGQPKFIPVTDAVSWLQDFQRVLKRDNDTYRQVGLFIGKCRCVAQKLLPMLVTCRYDKALVLTVCKILVILTKPLNEAARNAGRLTIDVKSGKMDDNVLLEQQILRDNAIAQSDLLMEYKRLFVRHPSHSYAFQNNGKKPKGGGEDKRGTGLMSVLVTLLSEPLDKTGASRTAADHLQIELVLQLIRHLLCISPINNFGSPEKAQMASQLHSELMIVLKEEMVFDMLVIIGQEVGRRENAGYNLLLMEIMGKLLSGQDPSDIARSSLPPVQTLSAPVTLSKGGKKSSKAPVKRVVRTTTSRASASGSNSLKAVLQTERSKLQLSASSRHAHFGGTLMVTKSCGKKSYVSASDYLIKKSTGGGGAKGSTAGIAAPTRRKNKKAEVFVGSGKSSSLHSRPGASAGASREVAGIASRRGKRALDSFCHKFFKDCYGPVMKSLKNEFRRDSNRLEDGDRTLFFRIVWFFHQWWRVSMEQKKKENDASGKESEGTKSIGSEEDESSGSKGAAGNLIFTMDVFMFNLVLNSTDEFFEHKKPAALAQAAALYTEMIHMLRAMYDSEDSTERTMALGLMDRLFYATEPLDRLPRLLSRWSPGMFSREFLCDLVECTHVTLKLLDTNAERCLKSVGMEESERKRPKDAVERMNMTALEFDKDHYFMRKFVSNQIVFMYAQLLSQYAVNAADVNRHVAAYFIRLCKFTIKGDDVTDDLEVDDSLGKNELAAKQATMEPILYNISLFTVLDKILNDTTIRENQDFAALLMFASSFMKRFARAAEVNPMLYVEAMFKHPVPHRFCELSTNMYINDELRMIAVRDLLLEDQRRYEQQAEETVEQEEKQDEDGKEGAGYDDEEEEELEFNDDDEDNSTDGIMMKKKRRRKSRKSRKSKSKATTMEEDENGDREEENEADLHEDDGEETADIEVTTQEKGSELQGGNNASPEANVDTQDDAADAALPETDIGESSKLSGKKRIRKSLEAPAAEDSDDEDFGDVAPVAKASKRVIFDDDDDDE